MVKKTEEDLKEIYNNLDENEKFGLSFGLFPFRLEKMKLDNHECAELIGISQKKSGVEF